MRIGRTATVVKASVRHVIEVVLAVITVILHGETGAVWIEGDGEAYMVPIIYTGMSTLSTLQTLPKELHSRCYSS